MADSRDYAQEVRNYILSRAEDLGEDQVRISLANLKRVSPLTELGALQLKDSIENHANRARQVFEMLEGGAR